MWYAKKLRSLWSILELIELQLSLNKIIPYKFRYSSPHLDAEEIWDAAVKSSPILAAYSELCMKTKQIISMYRIENDVNINVVPELYNDMLAMYAINDIIMSNIFSLAKPKTWIINKWAISMSFFIAIWYSIIEWSNYLENFIYTFIAIFLILTTKDFIFPEK